MRFAMTLLTIGLLGMSAAMAQDTTKALDNNTAFYEGEKQNYVIPPPEGFKMIFEEAVDDGFSFAFIPDSDNYDSASIILGVNMFRIKEDRRATFNLNDLIASDTSSIREVFGGDLQMEEVNPIGTEGGQALRTLYLKDTTTFIPNVMMSYYYGGSEVIIFDLSVSGTIPRFKAEDLYVSFLKNFKILPKGTLENEG